MYEENSSLRHLKKRIGYMFCEGFPRNDPCPRINIKIKTK